MMHAVKGAEFEFFFVEKFQFLGFWKSFTMVLVEF